MDRRDYGYHRCVKCGRRGLRFKNNPCSKCKREMKKDGKDILQS